MGMMDGNGARNGGINWGRVFVMAAVPILFTAWMKSISDSEDRSNQHTVEIREMRREHEREIQALINRLDREAREANNKLEDIKGDIRALEQRERERWRGR